jgi:hypothetical protein
MPVDAHVAISKSSAAVTRTDRLDGLIHNSDAWQSMHRFRYAETLAGVGALPSSNWTSRCWSTSTGGTTRRPHGEIA